jgi:hypothetical protein
MKESLPMMIKVYKESSSCAEPAHPATTNMNLISKSHMASIFCDVYP